jgi:hypothetical protein
MEWLVMAIMSYTKACIPATWDIIEDHDTPFTDDGRMQILQHGLLPAGWEPCSTQGEIDFLQQCLVLKMYNLPLQLYISSSILLALFFRVTGELVGSTSKNEHVAETTTATCAKEARK